MSPTTLLWFLPEGAEPLLFAGIAFALMLGLISQGRAFALIARILLVITLGPLILSVVIGAALEALSAVPAAWLVLAAVIAVPTVLWLAFRWVLGTVLGQEGAGVVIGEMALAPFRRRGRRRQDPEVIVVQVPAPAPPARPARRANGPARRARNPRRGPRRR
jgi:hypothetical protein